MLVARVLTVLIALPIFAAALLLLPQGLWAFFLLPGVLIASWEWAGLAGYGRTARGLYAAAVVFSALAIFYLMPLASGTPLDVWMFVVSCAFWAAVVPFWLGARWRMRNPFLLGVAGWITLVPMWLALVRLQASPWALLFFMSVIWIADTAAYAAGKQWGRHKLAPLISPGKSWEGVIGAAVAVGLYYLAVWYWVPAGERYFQAWAGLGLFAALLILSIEGDLFESWIKRQAGVKDSGSLLPGHGGLLDRIDGLTSTMPAAALAFYLR